MSRHMQITVTIRPFYDRDFTAAFPKLASGLRAVGAAIGGQDPSLYELAGKIDTLLYKTDGTRLREALMPYKDELKKSYAAAEEEIANRNLAGADKLLYRIEDIFEEIESGLG